MNRALAEVIAKVIQGKVQQVLTFFSGPDDAPENLAAWLLWLGITAIQIDIVALKVISPAADIYAVHVR